MRKYKKKITLFLFLISAVFVIAGLLLLSPATKKFSRAEGDQPINLYDYNDMHWALANGGSLGADCYKYSYIVQDESLEGDVQLPKQFYYSATQLSFAPDPTWSEWKFEERLLVTSSTVIANGFEQTIEIVDIPKTETNEAKYEVEYLEQGTNTAIEPTSRDPYRAVALLKAKSGYYFEATGDEINLSERGIKIEIRDDNGAPAETGTQAYVTKEWFIVNGVNEILQTYYEETAEGMILKSKPYAIPSWEFGRIDSVSMPYLKYGDERFFADQAIGSYKLSFAYYKDEMLEDESYRTVFVLDDIVESGEDLSYEIVQGKNWLLNLLPNEQNVTANDFLTFTLKKVGESKEICANANRSQWDYYLNKYMPVGEYEITIETKLLALAGRYSHWWDMDVEENSGIPHSLYQSVSHTYRFSVTPAKFEIDLTGTRESIVNLADLKKNGFEKTVNDIFAPTGVQPTGGVIVTESELRANGGYWAARAEELYEFEPALAYNVSDFMSDEYYALNDDIWNAHISTEEAKTYTLFYKAVMKNYVWNVNLPEEKYENALTLQVYQELAVPVFANDGKAVYTGEEIAVVLTDQSAVYLSQFTIEPNQKLLSARQDYVVTFALRDPVHYKWVGKDLGKAEIALDFVIEKAKITVPVLAHKTYNGEPLTPDEFNDIPTGADGNPIYRLDTAIPQNWINAGSYDIDLRLTDPANYEWRDVHQDPTGTPEQITIKFVIDPAQDDWKDSFRILPWEYGKFLLSANFFGGTTRLDQEVLYSVARDREGTDLCEGLVAFRDDINFPAGEFLSLPKGTYYIRAYTEECGNTSAIDGEWVPFEVTIAKNGWHVRPGVDAWTWGEFANNTIENGAPFYGNTKVMFYRLDQSGNRDEGKDNLDDYREGNATGLAGVPAGRYEMVVTVSASENYEAISETVIFEIGKGKNVWTVTPSVQSWIYGNIPDLQGEALYGEVTIAINSSDGITVYEGPLSAISDGEALRRTKPGNYNFIARVADHNNYTALVHQGDFRISSPNSNRWVYAPQIESWTVGETPKAPVFEAAYNDSAKYYRFETKDGIDLGNRAPEVAGEYVLVACVPAAEINGSMCDPLETRVPFHVYERPILTNVWTVAPNIQGWKEGELAGEPIGTPEQGEVTFAYKTAAGDMLASKPTAAGEYILIATAKAAYYHDLVAEVRFTVAPAPVSVSKTAQDSNGNPVYLTVDGVAAGTSFELAEIANAGGDAGFFKRTKNALADLGYALGAIYDITMSDANGTAVQPDGVVTVTVTLPQWLRNKSGLQVAYVNDRGEVELMGGTVSGENITFTTTHFSTYCLVWSDGGGSAAKTGWAIFLTVLIEFCVIAALATSAVAFVIVYKRIRAAESETACKPVADQTAAEESAEASDNRKPDDHGSE